MQFLLQVVADELTNTKHCFLLWVKYFVVWENIGMFVEVEGSSYLIDFVLIIAELVIFYLAEM